MKKVILIFIAFLFIMCNNNKLQGSYKALIVSEENHVSVFLNIDEKMGDITIDEQYSKDSIVNIQKYIIYRNGDTISLSSEFEDRVHTYLLKDDDNKLIISSIPNTKDSLLFGYNFKKITLKKQEAN